MTENKPRHCIFSTGAASLLIAFGFTLTSPAQDPKEPEPPIRLKKKDRPEEAKPADKEPAREEKAKEAPSAPAEEAKQIMERIAKNMRAAEDRLKSKDAGDATQQVQRDIVKDLDKLIEQSQQQDQNPDQAQQSQPGMGGGKARGSRAQQRQGSRQQARPATGQGGGSEQQGKGQSASRDNQGRGVGSSPPGANPLEELRKTEAWGDLPAALRQQMDAYAREGFMLKYQDLLRQYYATLAEKGSRNAEGKR